MGGEHAYDVVCVFRWLDAGVGDKKIERCLKVKGR